MGNRKPRGKSRVGTATNADLKAALRLNDELSGQVRHFQNMASRNARKVSELELKQYAELSIVRKEYDTHLRFYLDEVAGLKRDLYAAQAALLRKINES